MTVARRLVSSVALAVAACSSSHLDVGDQLPSTGLKIFVTSRGHISDFIDDAMLSGPTAIAKADAFCNTDPSKPAGETYEGLLVDGVNRTAKPPVDWPLLPNTSYYRTTGNVLIGTTDGNAIFDAEYMPLANAVGPTPASTPDDSVDPDDVDQVWTGIGNAVDFSTGNTCGGWTGTGDSGSRGVSVAKDGAAFYSAGDYACGYFKLYLYCVEQRSAKAPDGS